MNLPISSWVNFGSFWISKKVDISSVEFIGIQLFLNPTDYPFSVCGQATSLLLSIQNLFLLFIFSSLWLDVYQFTIAKNLLLFYWFFSVKFMFSIWLTSPFDLYYFFSSVDFEFNVTQKNFFFSLEIKWQNLKPCCKCRFRENEIVMLLLLLLLLLLFFSVLGFEFRVSSTPSPF
jgi:hypothetical protein